MNYYAIGVPVGRLNEGSERYFCRGGQLLNMSAEAFALWVLFLHGADSELVLWREAGQADSAKRAVLDALVASGLLVPQEELLSHVPQRQGYGVGYSQRDHRCRVQLGDGVRVSYPAFLLWAYCDGRSTCLEILNRLPAEVSGVFTQAHARAAIQELLRENLILFED